MRGRVSSAFFVILATLMVLSNAFFFQLSQIAMLFLSFALVVTALVAFVSTNLRTLMVGVAALCVCLSIWTTNWPLKLRFQVSKSSFEKAVNKFEAGEQSEYPRMVGLFRVLKVKKKNKGNDGEAVCFYVAKGDFQGVAFCQKEVRFNIWSHIEFDDRWHYIIED